jgi:hypothetical protein
VKRKRVLLSGATTPAALVAGIENGHGATSRATLQPILEALQQLSGAVYGRAGEADTLALNNAVDEASAAVRSLWIRSRIPFTASARGSRTSTLPSTRSVAHP